MQAAMRAAGTNVPIMCNLYAYEYLGTSAIYAQCIRWKRKPMWLGTAKTKLFRIPQAPPKNPEEYNEMKRLTNNYRTYMKSIMKYYKDLAEQDMTLHNEEFLHKEEEEDFLRCEKINNEWNALVAKDREIRLAKERKIREDTILETLARKEQETLALQQKIDEEIKKVKAEAHTFITSKNIDEAIKIAMTTVVDYDTAIDMHGNLYREECNIEEGESNTVAQ